MYLSRIQLNPQRRRTRWLLSSPQRVHAEVLNSFPDARTGDQAGGPRVLWRLDVEERKTYLYISSPDAPDLTKLSEEAGWATAPGEVKGYDRFLERLAHGQEWAFRLSANPVRYEPSGGTERAKRHAHVTVGYQEQWLAEKAEGSGFSVASDDAWTFTLTKRTTHRFTRRNGSASVTIATAQFDGLLAVTDADALRRSLVTGVGPAKAYGCGLLTLARPGG